MIGAVVTLRFTDSFDESAVRKVAESASALFEGMPGLRSKAFTVNPAKREAVNFYVWDSEHAAKAFYTPGMLDRIAAAYGVRPELELVELVSLVENAPARAAA